MFVQNTINMVEKLQQLILILVIFRMVWYISFIATVKIINAPYFSSWWLSSFSCLVVYHVPVATPGGQFEDYNSFQEA